MFRTPAKPQGLCMVFMVFNESSKKRLYVAIRSVQLGAPMQSWRWKITRKMDFEYDAWLRGWRSCASGTLYFTRPLFHRLERCTSVMGRCSEKHKIPLPMPNSLEPRVSRATKYRHPGIALAF